MSVQEFYKTFFIKDKIPSIYSKINYFHNQAIFYSNDTLSKVEDVSSVNFIKLFPKYLNESISNTKKYHQKKITQAKLDGFGILINDEKDIDTYLLNNFKSSTRSPIKKKLKRLEDCFTIKYEFFFGNNLSKDNYETIMVVLKNMITRRFNQKNDINEALDKWNTYYLNVYNQIINKEASLFVVSENDNIISISLNYHAEKILIGHLIAFDIDFSKFGLGNTIIYKLLDWCIKNNYSILDMGNGELEYKNIWSNFSYHYEYHFIYKKNSIIDFFKAHYLMAIIKTKNILKNLKIIELLKKAKSTFASKNNIKSDKGEVFKIEELTINTFNSLSLTKINASDPSYKNLKKMISDFIFLKKEHMDNIEVYSSTESFNVIKGKTSIIKISVTNS